MTNIVAQQNFLAYALPALICLLLFIIFVLYWKHHLTKNITLRQKAEARFNTIAANIPGAIFQAQASPGEKPKYLYLSAGAVDFFGVSPETVIKEHRTLPYHPEDRKRINNEIDEVVLRQKPLNVVGRILTPKAEVKWIRLTASPNHNISGTLIYDGLILDITDRKTAELEYRSNERKIKAMSRAVDDALIMIDGQGKVMFWNPAAERLFGYSEQDAMGIDFHTMAAPEHYHPKAYEGLKRFSQTGEGAVIGVTTEITGRDRTGREFPVEVTLSSFRIEGKWYAAGTVRDISQRKQVEKAVKDSEQRMLTILDSISTGIMIVDPETHTVFDVNSAAVNMIGLPREKIVGQRCSQFICINEDLECPITCYKQQSDKAERILLTGQGDKVSIIKSVVSINLSGKEYLLESMVDISERIMTEKKLTESQSRLDTALAASNTGLWDWNAATQTAFHNEQWFRQLGYSRSDFDKKADVLGLLMHPEDKEKFYDHISECDAQGIIDYNMEFRMKAKDGSWKWIHSLGKVVEKDAQGKPARIVGVHLDITDRKKNEHELAASQQKLEQIIDFLPDPTWVIDQDSKVVAWNQAMVKLTGVSEQEILGKGDYEYALPFYGERRPILIDLVSRWDQETGDKYLSVKHKDGGVLVSESFHPELRGGSYLSGTATAFSDASGNFEGAIETVRDISEQKKAQAELQKNLEDLERFSRLVVGREEKMIQLKDEINKLLDELGRSPKYTIVQ